MEMSDIYTQEMRIFHEACPICWFWHSALSCPPQVAGMSTQILALRSEVERLRKGLQHIVDTVQYWDDEGYGVTVNENTLAEIAEDVLNGEESEE